MTNSQKKSLFVLRPTRPDDQAFLDTLYFHTHEDLQIPGADPDFVRQLIRMQQQAQLRGIEQVFPQASHWLIEKKPANPTEWPTVLPEPCGRVVLNSSTQELRLLDMAVMPQHRRSGVGRTVLQALQEQARASGQSLSLAVSKTNHAARQLYLGMGFKVCSADELFEQMEWRLDEAEIQSNRHVAQ